MTTPYLFDVPIGTWFRTAKWDDVLHASELTDRRPTCMYLRCHCVYVVTGVVMTRVAQNAPKHRTVDVIRRCASGAGRHEDTHRTTKLSIHGRRLPMGTLHAYTRVVIVDALVLALSEELAASRALGTELS